MSVREELERKMTELPDLTRRPSRYGDSHSYFVGGREIAHFHGDGRMDLRLTRQWIGEARRGGRLDPRLKTRGSSADWATVPLEDSRDAALALRLVEEAIRANA